MKQFTYSFTTTVEFSRPVAEHAFVLRCLPASRDAQEVWAQVDIDPDVPASLQRDNFGNTLVVGYIADEHDHFTYTSHGTAVVGGTLGHLPNTLASIDAGALHSGMVAGGSVSGDEGVAQAAHPLLRFPSPLARASRDMRDFARQAGLVAGQAPVDDPQACEEGCERLMHALHGRLAYEPGSTTVDTPADEAFAQGRGVCQDFTHVMIALLREWGLPARYASGLTAGCGTTHAWAQAFIGGAWRGFDPTRDERAGDTYLTLAVGRDWSDCPIERGTFQGLADQTQTVFMRMEER